MATIAQHMKDPLCPVCGKPATATDTAFGVRHACCGLHSWDGKPLVTPETHDARRAAHAAFDPLWKDGPLRRSDAYKALAKEMGMSKRDCHISMMNEGYARLVPAAVERIKEALLKDGA